ncbi:MAG: tyrosine-type recombinase/integrase, partial [Patescibacteria group bacterium]|nr:tyrosine-type recombinase/integrase [Patescibacteria group bacterium]
HHVRPDDPTAGIELPRIPRREPKHLDERQVATLVASLPTETPRDVRDRAIVVLALNSGMRCGEVAGLALAGLDWARGQAVIIGKGSKQRRVPLAGPVVEALRAWLAIRPAADHERVFCAPGDMLPVTPGDVGESIRKAYKRAGIAGFRPHDLRHTFATRTLAAGVPMHVIQAWMGHSSIATTQIYAHTIVDASHLALLNGLASPRSSENTEEVNNG